MDKMSRNAEQMLPATERPEPNGTALSRRSFGLFATSALTSVGLSPGRAVAAATRMASGAKVMPEEAQIQKIPARVYGDDAYPVWYRRAEPPKTVRARYPGFHPETLHLRKGEIRREGAKPLSCDIMVDRDVAVPLRDGTIIYADVFRPAKAGQYPGIVCWSPYGKEIGNQHLDDLPGRFNIPLSKLSDLQKWEALDPAFWVEQGFAIINPDSRGAYGSEGNFPAWGRQLAEDGHDLIEWLAKQKWCSGKLGMAGNSWLSISQWFIAAERPPHLAAIAPWEGFSDVMRDQAMRGGIPQVGFNELFLEIQAGNALIEDTVRMAIMEPNDTPYWKDKSARFERIEIPAFVTASYENMLHTRGTFDGFRRISSKHKWLRVHNNHEWFDLYQESSEKELLSFFEHYLKGMENAWPETPKVRISVLDPGPGRKDDVNRVVDAWPPSGYEHQKLYLQADASMSPTPAAAAVKVGYPATGKGSAVFRKVIEQDSELIGYMKARIWVEAIGSNDMDVIVTVEKVGKDGKPLPRDLPQGGTAVTTAFQYQRASRREIDPVHSTEAEPILLLQGESLLKAGEIVPLDIGIWPTALKFHAGEVLQITIAPYEQFVGDFKLGAAQITVPRDGLTYSPSKPVPMQTLGDPDMKAPAYVANQAAKAPGRNAGTHVIHLGGHYDSHLLVPLKAS